jgi:hypothetical protein
MMSPSEPQQETGSSFSEPEVFALATLLLQWQEGPAALSSNDLEHLKLAHRALYSLIEACNDAVGGSC